MPGHPHREVLYTVCLRELRPMGAIPPSEHFAEDMILESRALALAAAVLGSKVKAPALAQVCRDSMMITTCLPSAWTVPPRTVPEVNFKAHALRFDSPLITPRYRIQITFQLAA